jgi:hypothetical protein
MRESEFCCVKDFNEKPLSRSFFYRQTPEERIERMYRYEMELRQQRRADLVGEYAAQLGSSGVVRTEAEVERYARQLYENKRGERQRERLRQSMEDEMRKKFPFSPQINEVVGVDEDENGQDGRGNMLRHSWGMSSVRRKRNELYNSPNVMRRRQMVNIKSLGGKIADMQRERTRLMEEEMKRREMEQVRDQGFLNLQFFGVFSVTLSR